MSLQYGVAVRNAMLDAIEATIGTSPKLQLRSGSPPANCAASATGTLLAEITLPSNWLADASSGAKALAGDWSGVGASGAAAGTDIGHFRILDSGGSTCHMQGTVTEAGGGGDMIADNQNIAEDQAVSITSFSITRGNA